MDRLPSREAVSLGSSRNPQLPSGPFQSSRYNSGNPCSMHLKPVPIGYCDEYYNRGEIRILPDARRAHVAIFGSTGSGKSTLLRNMIADDIAAGLGCTVIDPHGQLVEDILNNHIKRSRAGDVIHFDAKDL